jgi:hypothetical protein
MLTGEQLKEFKKRKEEYYRTIKEVILPEPFSHIKVFIGGCVERGIGSSFRHQAHAHNSIEDENFGYLCIRSIKRIGRYEEIKNEDGTVTIKVTKPSQLLLHEVAHILSPGSYHNKTWLSRYIEIGASKGKIERAKRRWKACN